jgi:hypothetical protein
VFLFVITLDPQPGAKLTPSILAHFFPLSGSRAALFRLDESGCCPRGDGVRMHALLQEVERAQRLEWDDQFRPSRAEQTSDGGKCKDECRGIENESGFRLFLLQDWVSDIGFRGSLVPATATPVSTIASPSPSPATSAKCKVGRYTIFELFNLVREVRGAEGLAEPRLSFCLRMNGQ